jgi:hypothetical protein
VDRALRASAAGEYEDAATRAMALRQRLANRSGLATTWHTLGLAYQRRDEHRRAVRCRHRAIDLFHEVGNRYAVQVRAHLDILDKPLVTMV